MLHRYFFVAALFLAGCVMPGGSTPSHYRLTRLEGTRVLVLTEPREVVLKPGAKPLLLTRGQYRAYFADAGGTYYEAPFSQNAQAHFSGPRRGGIYVVRAPERPRLYLYYQQNQMTSTYVYGSGVMTMGGDNTFTIGDELPASFADGLSEQLKL